MVQEYNVTDSGGENDLEVKINVPKREWESKSGELVSSNPNITDVCVGSMKQTVSWHGGPYQVTEHSKRVKETVAKIVEFKLQNNPDSQYNII